MFSPASTQVSNCYFWLEIILSIIILHFFFPMVFFISGYDKVFKLRGFDSLTTFLFRGELTCCSVVQSCGRLKFEV